MGTSTHKLTAEDLELHREMYEPYADYYQRLMSGEDRYAVGIGAYGLSDGYLVRTGHNNRAVRVPTSFKNAKQLVHDIHVEYGHLGVEDMGAVVRDRLFVQFQAQLIEHVVAACKICAGSVSGKQP